MKTVSKKLFSLLLVAVLLVSVLPFQASAASKIHVTFMKYNWDGTYSVAKELDMDAPTMTYHVTPSLPAPPTGWRYLEWAVYTPGMTFDQVNASPKMDMGTVQYNDIIFAPRYAKDNYTVSFNANMSGVTSPAAMTVTNGNYFSQAGAYPGLSSITGYTFGGWKYGDTILTAANWGSVKFTSGANVTLDAHWIPDTVKVYFNRWNGTGYERIAGVDVKYGEYVKASDVPTMTAVNTKPSYEAIGWQTTAGADAVAVEPTAVRITGETDFYARYQGDVVTITLDYRTDKLDPDTKEVRIGEKIGNYGGKLPTPTLAGYVFAGWETVNGTPITDDTVFMNSYSKLQAKWAEAASVRLIVKNVANGSDIYNNLIAGGAKNGLLKTSSINLSQYLPAGSSYKVLGYMDSTSYQNYLVTKIVNSVDNVQCTSVGVTEVYVLVEVLSTNTNTNTGSGSNNTGSGNNTGSNKPADPTNPATGDNSMIVTSMTVMTLSAAALVVFMQLRKRKMI